MKKPKFAPGEIYHVYNRGVEKRNVFLGIQDYSRFIRHLYELNSSKPAFNLYRPNPNLFEVRLQTDILVNILAFCLMPNHYHLLLQEVTDRGLVRFMQKLGTGYTNYFNILHKRVGPLFQGTFKAVHVLRNAHLKHLPHYIHLNPLDLYDPGWRTGKLKNVDAALKHVQEYSWSSYQDFIGNTQHPGLIQNELLIDVYGGSKKYKLSLDEWLHDLPIREIGEVPFF